MHWEPEQNHTQMYYLSMVLVKTEGIVLKQYFIIIILKKQYEYINDAL